MTPELQSILKEVSRSFYLTLRILPGRIRPQIGLAYLLARAADTLADSHLLPRETRLDLLDQFRRSVLEAAPLPTLEPWMPSIAHPGERRLLERLEACLTLLNTLSPSDQHRIRDVLRTIISGQAMDLRRFGSSQEDLAALTRDQELDEYTYQVAGCVGEFWTRLCRAHLFPGAPLDELALLENGIRFGKGLQLVNILRDLPRDLRKGRCYIPSQILAECELTPRDLLNPEQEPRFRPCLRFYLDRAEDHLRAGWRYTLMLPRRCMRLRLACAWPALIGFRTLDQLRDRRILNPDRSIKIPREEVRSILWQTVWLYPFDQAWRRLPGEGRERPAEKPVAFERGF